MVVPDEPQPSYEEFASLVVELRSALDAALTRIADLEAPLKQNSKNSSKEVVPRFGPGVPHPAAADAPGASSSRTGHFSASISPTCRPAVATTAEQPLPQPELSRHAASARPGRGRVRREGAELSATEQLRQALDEPYRLDVLVHQYVHALSVYRGPGTGRGRAGCRLGPGGSAGTRRRHPRRPCACRQSRPRRSSGISVLVNDPAETVSAMYPNAFDPGRFEGLRQGS